MFFKRETYKTEESLIKGCVKGKEKAQFMLYEQYKGIFYGLCLRYCRNKTDAEEVLQEGFVKIFNSISKFEGKGSFEGWMKRIIIFTSIDYYRSKSKKNEVLNEFEDHEVDNEVNANILEAMDAELIIDLLQQLPNGYRTVLNMYAIEGYTHKEIAQKLEISEGTSKSQLSKARKLFQNILNEAGVER